jgi:hypothetical protein
LPLELQRGNEAEENKEKILEKQGLLDVWLEHQKEIMKNLDRNH